MAVTTQNRAHEVLYESEATLRLVDNEIDDLRGVDTPPYIVSLGDLPALLDRANAQIHSVLGHLRETRAALQSSAFAKLQSTHEKIREVTTATEDAATNIMDACDRANSVVDELDAIDADATPDRERASALRMSLRDELFLMMGALQFQDITSQQLNHASTVLVEMEARLDEVAKLFDANINLGSVVAPRATPDQAGARDLPYDPDATVKNASGRQALADEIFTPIKAQVA